MQVIAFSKDQMVYESDPVVRIEKVEHNLSAGAHHSSFAQEDVPPFSYEDPDHFPLSLEWYEGFVLAHYCLMPDRIEPLLAEIKRLEQEESESWDGYDEMREKEISL